MNRVISAAPGKNHLSVTPYMPRTQQSLLFPTLIKKIDPDRRLSVLEIGPAFPETMEFFSHFKCRLHFAGMYSDPLLKIQSGKSTETELVRKLVKALGFPKNTRFDLCLFWDFLNYLDDKVLRAFNTAIEPFIHQTTRAHAFTVRTLDTGLPNQQYGINESHMFRVRPRSTKQMSLFPKTQTTLVNLLPCFDIDQGMLLPDGRLEVLMTASKRTDNSQSRGRQTFKRR